MRRPLAKRFIVTIVIIDLERPFNERARSVDGADSSRLRRSRG